MSRIDDHLWCELVRRPEAPRALSARQPRPLSLRRAASGTQEDGADRAAQGFSRRGFRLTAARPRGTSPVALLATAGGLLAGAVAAVLLLTAGGAPSVAFAGWSASPTPAPSSQIAAAEAQCLARAPEYLKIAELQDENSHKRESVSRQAGANGGDPPTAPPLSAFKALPALEAGEWPTVLKDTRGPYTSLIRESSDGQGVLTCDSGPSNPHGSGWVALELPTPSAGGVRLTSEGGYRDVAAKKWVAQVEGRTGRGVMGVTVVLEDGTHVEATTTNGWFLAWWPGNQRALSAELTTASGVSTQKLQFD